MDAFLATMQQVLDYLHTIKITDLIDIAIISYIFYKIILFAKETRAGQVLRGIGLVIFLLWIANVFNLHILAYILSKAVELGFLALVVVFQPEIRHFLEKMGSGRFRLTAHNIGQPSSDLETAIDQTVEAYAAMSKDKVGALVVFERNSILDATLKTAPSWTRRCPASCSRTSSGPRHPCTMVRWWCATAGWPARAVCSPCPATPTSAGS